jgi:uncharacterized membrane protein HdeD (DUF308 family)
VRAALLLVSPQWFSNRAEWIRLHGHAAWVVQARAAWRVAMLSNVLSRYWWITLLRGVFWILFALAIFLMPGVSLLTLTLMFGFFVLLDGVTKVASAFSGRHEYVNWWVQLVAGLAGILVGILTFVSPGTTVLALILYIAIWAIATGILEIVTAIHLRKEIEGEFWLVLAGLATVVFGVLLVARPGVGALTVLWMIAAYALVIGVTLIVVAFRARSFVNRLRAA